MEIHIDAIDVGDRHRKDLGDVKSLANSIDSVGLLHPIVITNEHKLIAGARRIAAYKLLGKTQIPATVVDLEKIATGELAENVDRKNFTPSEINAIRKTLEPQVKTPVGRPKKRGQIATISKGKTRDKVAAFAGVSPRTLQKIKALSDAAEADPERFGSLVEEMDRKGRPDAPYRKLKRAQDEDRVLSVQPVAGKFKTLVVDPPWFYDNYSPATRGRPEYAEMTLEEIAALDVPGWADDEFCHLYLWSTLNFVLEAGKLIERWGFAHKTQLAWVKPKWGLGSYFRHQHEVCLFATRGNKSTRADDISTVFEAVQGEHSEKPEIFYEIVRRASYPPYGEAFQRSARDDFINLFEVTDSAAAGNI